MVAERETPTIQQSVLEGAIDLKLLRAPRILRYKRDINIAFLQAPTDVLAMENGVPRLFADRIPQGSSDILHLTLLQAPERRAITLSVSPQDPKAPSAAVWRIDFPQGETPKVEFRLGANNPIPLSLDPEAVPALLSVIEKSTVRERSLSDYQEMFLSKVRGIWTEQEIKWGLNGLKNAYELHKGQRRKSGEPYFLHPWSVVEELLNQPELIRDAAMINAAWIHDIGEDVPDFKQPERDPITGKAIVSHEKYAKGLHERFAELVGSQSAKYGVLMTRPQPDGIGFFSKEDSNGQYYVDIIKFVQVIMIKMSDRLHNARTLWAMPEEKQRATLRSTKNTYFPIYELAREAYPEAVDYFMFETEKALRLIAESLGEDYDSIQG